ncbi:hypothetical protein MPSEU_000178600 [Mayamaea pseudoterrestris]|nr:hypothetical protein MPSEU_000178600 [Mayamaea pseudoterrestris]
MIRSCSGFTIRLSRQMSRGIMHRSMLGRSMRLSIGKASLLAHDPVAEMPTLHSAALKNDTLLSLVHSDHDEDNQERNSVVNDQDEHAEVTRLVETWKAHPRLNPTVVFRSLCVKDSSQIHTIVNAPEMQDHLASRLDLLSHLHTRIKVVRDSENGDKMILLHPDAPPFQELPTFVQDACTPGSVVPIKFAYNQFTASYTLLQILPSHIHPPPTAFETIGHVIHMNLRSHHFPYRYLIGQVLLESLRSHVKTVLVKVGQVTGPFRTYDFEIVAGENNTLVDVVEAGLRLQFDMAKVYWCSRLSEERQRMLNLIEKGALIADPFCGVGALCLHAAARDASCFVLANDWNPSAIEWLHKNAKSNGIDAKQIQAKCGDAYDFLMDLGLSEQHPLPDHVVMNFPLEGPKFLGALRWWAKHSDVIPRVHVYTFARPTDGLSAEEVAVEIIASNLIAGLAPGAASCRRQELDECYDCNLQLHAVRDVAPGKTVYCVSFSATPQLIKAMQGDF